MKKIVAFILLTCMILSFAACGKVEVTMQEIYDAAKTEALLKDHESVYIRNAMDGELWREIYLTEDYVFDYIPDEEFPYVKFMTDDVSYRYDSGKYLLYLYITPDGVGDFAGERAETYSMLVVGEDSLDDIIESVEKKDGRITVKTVLSEKTIELWAELGVTAGKFEYVLDAKSREILSLICDYTNDDGSALNTATELTYDAEAPEMLKEFLKYESQTENLRNVTVISNPGTDKEESKTIQAPKGLIIGFEFSEDFEAAVEFYTDAACTVAYDPFADVDSDISIYVKWN